jgi:hypothetical protein
MGIHVPKNEARTLQCTTCKNRYLNIRIKTVRCSKDVTKRNKNLGPQKKKKCTQMFMVVVFIIAKKQKQHKYPPTE